MNSIIKNIYILLKDNKVVVCDNNVKNFYDNLPIKIKSYKSYAYFNREFKKSAYFPLDWDNDYMLQRIDF
jgi:hypothetical protein